MKSVYCILILLGVYAISTQKAYGQRVYADIQESITTPLLASVTNEGNAVDVDTTNYSTLNVSLGIIGAIGTATQNLQFTGTTKPQPTAPLMMRFRYSGAILGLSNIFEVQRTSGGLDNTVGDSYSGSTLLGLLGLDSSDNPEEVTVPVPGTNEPTDGVRLRLRAILGVGPSADLYYAFFITPPTVESPIPVCEGESALISISNFQPGYTYTIYDALTGGNLLLSGTSDVLSLSMEGRTTGTYYIEAVEGETEFASSRTAFTITIYPKPGNPDIDLNVNQN